MSPPSLLAGSLALLALAACAETFTPFAPDRPPFAVYGYLDASADTQWLRVTPVRDVVWTSPDSIGVAVTLQHTGTGQVVALRDSLFRFAAGDSAVGSAGVFVHNFWTTTPIEPGTTYRVAVRRGAETPAEALVSVPRWYDVSVFLRVGGSVNDYLQLAGLAHVAFVSLTTYNRCNAPVATNYFTENPTSTAVHTVPLQKLVPQVYETCGSPGAGKWDLKVFGSEAEWPALQGDPLASPGPDEGNVTGSRGFVGGVLSRVVPYEQCAWDGGGSTPSMCELRYHATSASVRGTVTETRCGEGPSDSATVQLRELDPVPPRARVRSGRTNRYGEFSFGALEPGIRYEVRTRRPAETWDAIFSERTDTLVFAAGERRKYDVALQRLTPCPGL